MRERERERETACDSIPGFQTREITTETKKNTIYKLFVNAANINCFRTNTRAHTTHTHTHKQTNTHKYTKAHTHTHTHTNKQTHTNTQKHTHIHTHTHTHTHIHACGTKTERSSPHIIPKKSVATFFFVSVIISTAKRLVYGPKTPKPTISLKRVVSEKITQKG